MKNIFTLLFLFASLCAFGQQNADPKSNDVSTKLNSNVDIQIYPNPTEDFFSIKNDANVSKVIIFNIIGREVRSFNVVSGTTYDISDLQKGIYVLRIIDLKGKAIKSTRLSVK